VLVVGLGGGAVLYLTKPWATAGPAPDNPPVVEPRANGGPAVAVVTSTTVRPTVRPTPATTVSNPVATRTTAPGKVTETAPPPKNPVPPGSDDPVPAMTFRGHSGGVFGVAVSRSGKTILSISDDRAVLQYSPQERGKHGVVHKLGSPGLAVALCDNDRVAVFCDGGETVVYDLAGRKVRATFENPRGGIRSLAAAPDGSFVLTGTTDGVVRWWGTKSKEIEHMLDLDAKGTVAALAVAPGGRTLAVGLSDGRVAVWDLKGRRETRRWPAHKGAVTAVAWSPDGNRIASAGEDGIANVWQPGGGLVKKLAGHDGPVTGVAWCPDGRRVLTTGIDQTVRLWAEDKGWKADRLGHTPDTAFCLAVDGRGRFVVVGLADGAVQLVPVPAAAAGSNN
jgi:WD40 repeat protein